VLLDCRDIIYDSILGRAWELGYHGRHSDQAKSWKFRGANLGQSSPNHPDRMWGHPASISSGTTVLPGIKQPERDIEHASPSSTEVKNEWSFTSALCLCV
jgi:hypothetical protein